MNVLRGVFVDMSIPQKFDYYDGEELRYLKEANGWTTEGRDRHECRDFTQASEAAPAALYMGSQGRAVDDPRPGAWTCAAGVQTSTATNCRPTHATSAECALQGRSQGTGAEAKE